MDTGELAAGLGWWTARHPDWEPRQSWDPVVRCFYVEADEATAIVDPLVPDDDAEALWELLDGVVARRSLPVAVLLTQAAHARSAGDVARRYDAVVWGHERAREKIGGATFNVVAPGDDVPGGRALEFAQEPRGSGTPLYLPSHRALAVGDVMIAIDGRLRYWWGHGTWDDGWFRDRLVPSIRQWLELPIEHVLVAHGEQVRGGGAEIAAALGREPHFGE